MPPHSLTPSDPSKYARLLTLFHAAGTHVQNLFLGCFLLPLVYSLPPFPPQTHASPPPWSVFSGTQTDTKKFCCVLPFLSLAFLEPTIHTTTQRFPLPCAPRTTTIKHRDVHNHSSLPPTRPLKKASHCPSSEPKSRTHTDTQSLARSLSSLSPALPPTQSLQTGNYWTPTFSAVNWGQTHTFFTSDRSFLFPARLSPTVVATT